PYDGPNPDIEDQRDYVWDMGYWEQYLLAAGAISLECCTMGPAWVMTDEDWEEQVESARKQCTVMALRGSPIMGYVGTIPE
ncbi:unnamed protein product, partial [marine sediment metagenome]